MASVYQRRKKWWCRLKIGGAWKGKPTPYSIAEPREKALRYAQTAQKQIDARVAGALTVTQYATKWIAARRNRGIASVGDDDGRITNHVLPVIGAMLMRDVKPRHLRDLVRALVRLGELAPRTIINVYGVTSTMFRDAVIDEVIETSPCVLQRGELPAKVDKDSEWRSLATYAESEVHALVCSPLIPIERRVQYAIKALAGLRHGEMAGLRWRHLNAAIAQLVIATSYDTGRTKTKVTRLVPVHSTLARVLESWRARHWCATYGREPELDDLIVPTRNMTPVDPTDAGRALKSDLDALGFRVDAGQHRDRGNHDLRAWFITTAQEHGAHRDLLRIVTHRSKSDVMGGYTRATWAALCAEVGKLRFEISDEDLLKPCDTFATRSIGPRGRWKKVATPTGFEHQSDADLVMSRAATIANIWAAENAEASDVSERVLRLVTRAIGCALEGDRVGAQRVYREIEAALSVQSTTVPRAVTVA